MLSPTLLVLPEISVIVFKIIFLPLAVFQAIDALVVMYAKCGCIEISQQLFEEMFKRDTISWNEIIVGYSQYGCFHEDFPLFNQLR